ncbi:MAG: ABC transporter permease [Deltaproteobacteria bacterium]|nr:ABC transporter permease [Deltaproteobacteria bacterium]
MSILTTARLKLLLRFALSGLGGQRGRSALTMLGMAIGTASVVAVISIGLVGRDYVVSLIEGVGTNLVIAYATLEGVNPEQISFEDVDVIRRRVPRMAAMAPVLAEVQMISIRRKPKSVKVLGAPPTYPGVRNLVTVSGRFITAREEASGAKVCVISRKLAQQLFGTDEVRGQSLRLFDLRFPIIGVFRERVESAAAVDQSEAAGLAAVIPFSTFRNLSDVRWLNTLYIQAADRESVPIVVESLREVLASRHRSMDDFQILSLQQYLTLVNRISDAISMGLLGIAGVSLLVGGIGIMNIMLVTVTERTRDIGIRLALGAGRRDILLQFLMEAGVLSLSGGLLGLLLGAVLPWYIGRLYGVEVPISVASVAVAFGVSVLVGVFFGLYPARKAANMNLVDALSFE